MIMTNLRLSAHFTLAEFERSATAARLGIDNTLDLHNPAHAAIIANLRNLCTEVLEPLRAFVNSSTPPQVGERPLVISSGYRCPQLNLRVGGAYASQHTLGEAADIHLPRTAYTDWADNRAHTDMAVACRWLDFLEHNTDFDQLILETSNDKDFWLHVSCRQNRSRNRHQVIRHLRQQQSSH